MLSQTISAAAQQENYDASKKEVAAFAGHYVLSELYPGQQSKFDVALQKQLGEIKTYTSICLQLHTNSHCGNSGKTAICPAIWLQRPRA